jgi:hypothetical protein
MRPVTFSRQLAAAVVGAVAAAQTTGGAGALVINGTLASGGVATLAAQQQLGFTSAGNDAAVVFTITGTNDQGAVVSETVTGVNANTVNTVLNYKTVTSITASAAVAVAVSVDTIALGASAAIPLDIYLQNGHTVSVKLTGAVNYTVQVTNDDPFNTPPSTPLTWITDPAIAAGSTTNQVGSTANVYRAVRLLTNSGAGSAQITVTQQGLIV